MSKKTFNYSVEIDSKFLNDRADCADINGTVIANNLIEATGMIVDYFKARYNIDNNAFCHLELFDDTDYDEGPIIVDQIRYFNHGICVEQE